MQKIFNQMLLLTLISFFGILWGANENQITPLKLDHTTPAIKAGLLHGLVAFSVGDIAMSACSYIPNKFIQSDLTQTITPLIFATAVGIVAYKAENGYTKALESYGAKIIKQDNEGFQKILTNYPRTMALITKNEKQLELCDIEHIETLSHDLKNKINWFKWPNWDSKIQSEIDFFATVKYLDRDKLANFKMRRLSEQWCIGNENVKKLKTFNQEMKEKSCLAGLATSLHRIQNTEAYKDQLAIYNKLKGINEPQYPQKQEPYLQLHKYNRHIPRKEPCQISKEATEESLKDILALQEKVTQSQSSGTIDLQILDDFGQKCIDYAQSINSIKYLIPNLSPESIDIILLNLFNKSSSPSVVLLDELDSHFKEVVSVIKNVESYKDLIKRNNKTSFNTIFTPQAIELLTVRPTFINVKKGLATKEPIEENMDD